MHEVVEALLIMKLETMCVPLIALRELEMK